MLYLAFEMPSAKIDFLRAQVERRGQARDTFGHLRLHAFKKENNTGSREIHSGEN